MKTLQLLVGIMCLSALLVESSAFEKVTITSISLDPEADINVCFKVDPAKAPTGTTFALFIGTDESPSPEAEHTMKDTYTEPENDNKEVCLNFKGASTISKGIVMFFILQGTPASTKSVEVTGIESIKFDSDIPGTLSAQWVGNNAVKTHGSTLRTKEFIGEWKLCGVGITTPATLSCKGHAAGPCYGVNIGSDGTDKVSLCDLNTNDVQFFVKSTSPTNANGAGGPIAATIALQYGAGKATLAATFTGDAATEALVYDGAVDGKIFICADVAACELDPYVPGDIALNQIFITAVADAATASSETTFQDSNLEVFKLDETVLESRWAHHTDKYAAERTTQVDILDTSFKIVDVDCKDNNGNCYAYFYITVNGDYDVTTKPGGVGSEVALNAIKSTAVSMKPVLSKSIDNYFRVIHVENVATTITANMIKLDVCFKCGTNVITNDTHYEFLAVNTKGKWKKQIHQEQIHSSDACFHELELPLADFSKDSKFFVILRDSNNGKPLSSGEVTFSLPVLRAIKPEVDNGSNGSSSTLAIIGAAIGGVACLMALVAAAIMFVMKINRDNDGLQYPLHRTDIEDSNIIHGLDNPIPTM